MTELAEALKKWERKSESNRKIVPIAMNAEPYLAASTEQLDADPVHDQRLPRLGHGAN